MELTTGNSTATNGPVTNNKHVNGNGVINGNHVNEEWTPFSWRTKPIRQAVVYEDQEHLQRALNKLQRLPPMVTPLEVFYLLNSPEKKNI